MSAQATRREVIAGSAVAAGLAGAGVCPGEVLASPAPESRPAGPGERLSLDRGWRFLSGDVAFPAILDHEAAYSHAKAGNAEGAAATDFDDMAWAEVDLPHDWALAQPFDQKTNLDQAYKARGIGWYRRYFQLDQADRDRSLELQFDGVATQATVWINGTLVHRHFNGFTSFTIDLSPFALFGDDLNTLAVRVDADATEGWWYEGAGIYRHVLLLKRSRVHIVTDGIHADPRREADGGWTVPVDVTVANTEDDAASLTVEAVLRDPAGLAVGHGASPLAADGNRNATASLSIALAGPQPWSPDAPALYRLETRLLRAGTVIDAADTNIGFRTLRFDPDQGLLINDRPLKIKGVCAHQDHAGVGAALPDSLWDFRLRRLKAMGANAIRCAHNPPAAELLDAADRLGVMVMDENRHFSAAEDVLADLAWMVRRDRNHPSVILWSLCNEESLQSSASGLAIARRMKAVVRALDTSRPVTAALNGAMFAQPNVAAALDVVGFNYGQHDYDRYHAANPSVPLLSSEDTAAYMTRGALRTDKARHELADDDSEHTDFGQSWREAWRSIGTRPFIAGGFAWAGFDYRGEPSPYTWPTASASFGAMDLCGFAKSAFHLRRALWTEDEAVLELNPHWTWPGREGETISVMAITNAERVLLRLNGRIVGDLAVDPYAMVRTDLRYEPGQLEAIAYRQGRPVAHRLLETAGPAHRLRLTPDRTRLWGDGCDTVPVTVEAFDARGRAVPIAQHAVSLTVAGGTILGVGNGDPNSHESDLPTGNGLHAARRLFNGLAQILVQTRQASGRLTLTAQAPGLKPATVTLAIDPRTLPAVAAADGRQSLTEWRQAPPSATPPDLGRTISDDDMNSWSWLKPGSAEPGDPAKRYVMMQTRFTPRLAVAAHGGEVLFTGLAGSVTVWLDGRQVVARTNPATAEVRVPLLAGRGEHVLQLLFDTRQGAGPFGIAGTVTVVPAAAAGS